MSSTKPEQRAAARFRLRGEVGVVGFAVGLLTLVGMAMVIRSRWPFPLLLFVIPMTSALVAAWLRRLLLVVGPDGIWFEQLLRNRFVPVGELVAVTVEAHGLVQLALSNGEQLSLSSVTTGSAANVAKAIEQIILERDKRLAPALPQLNREGRSLADWSAALRGALHKGNTFRKEALSRDQLEAVLKDATLSLEQRVGAAIALRGEPGGAAQVLLVAEVTAHPKVRLALSQLARGVETEDEAILAQLEAEEVAEPCGRSN